MKNKVLNYIMENKMIEAEESVVIGVSGGADSMCLLHIMEEISRLMSIKLAVVHIHHGIRGETADRDAAFVEDYCHEKGVTCYVKRVNVPKLSKEWGMSEEEAGRRVRYEAFESVLREISPDGRGKIAVAHNADDAAETVLLNLFRGSGIKGMAGILPVRGHIIRPVLCLTRQEIEKYNEINNIEYVHDETNFETDYTRNKLRLQIMPAIKEGINAKASEHINATGQSLALIDDYMEKECEQIFKTIADIKPDTINKYNDVYVNADKFLKLHMAMQLQLVKRCLYTVAGRAKDITAKHIQMVRDLFLMNVGKSISLPYDMVATKEYEGVYIRKRAGETVGGTGGCTCASGRNEVSVEAEGTYSLKIKDKRIEFKIVKDMYNELIFTENQYTKWIECDIIGSNLLLRTRREGDYIIVDDKGSKKKLKDFFIDKKIPREERDHIALLARGSEIIWVVGYRLSAAYKVKHDTHNIYRIQADIYDGV